MLEMVADEKFWSSIINIKMTKIFLSCSYFFFIQIFLDVLSGEIEKNIIYRFYTDFSLFRQIKRQDTVVICSDLCELD
jgi:hypothetical protein